MSAQQSKQPVGRSSSKTVSSRFERSTDYRRRFLQRKKGLFGSKVYYCVYCGKLISRTNMQVDHLIPVQAAKSSLAVRNYIRFRGIFQGSTMRKQGINGTWNLVPACGSCNNKKSDKGGLWLVRGAIGQVLAPIFWYGITAVTIFSVLQFMATGGGLLVYVVEGLKWLSSGLQGLSGILG